MAMIGVFYGSSTGNSEKVAEKIVQAFGPDNAVSINVEDAGIEDLDRYKYLIFGTSTWGIGDMQDDWEEFIETIDAANLKNKKVALFGLGDQEVYSDSFVDGMGKLYRKLKGKTNIVGFWPQEGYLFDESIAVVGDKFVGLPLDEDNQQKLTDERIINWVKMLQKEFT
jgi:flavodoxin I